MFGAGINDAESESLHFEIDFSTAADFSAIVGALDSSDSQADWEYYNGTSLVAFPSGGLASGDQSVETGLVAGTWTGAADGTLYYMRRRPWDGTSYGAYRIAFDTYPTEVGGTNLPINITGNPVYDGADPLHFTIDFSTTIGFGSPTNFDSSGSQTNWSYWNGTSILAMPAGGLEVAYQDTEFGWVGYNWTGATANTVYYVRYKPNGGSYRARVFKSRKHGETIIPVNLYGNTIVDGVNPLHFQVDFSLNADFSSATSFDTTTAQTDWYYFDGTVFQNFSSGGLATGNQNNDTGCVAFVWSGATYGEVYYLRYRSWDGSSYSNYRTRKVYT